MNKVKRWIIFCFCLGMVLLVGCRKEEISSAKYKIYYLNAEQTGLVEEAYRGETENQEKAVEEMLRCLREGTELIEEQSVIPDNVELLEYTLKNEKLNLYFSKEYYQMDVVQEVLCRAALVRSLTQLDGVELVMFYVDGEPLHKRDGSPYGYFQSEDFVQNTGSSIHSYEEMELTLYFSDKSGKKLVPQTETIKYNSNQSPEMVIVEQLMRGPSGTELRGTIPKGTKLLGSSLKNGICYLNFDEGLLQPLQDISPEVIIYSIVNSVMERENVICVRIAINGDSNLTFQESVKLGEPLSKNLKLLEE